MICNYEVIIYTFIEDGIARCKSGARKTYAEVRQKISRNRKRDALGACLSADKPHR
jgi:hypothetical protein